MTQKIDQDEINRILWRACDTFRGTVDPAEYKNYILVMLFVKYISDVWQDKKATYEEQFDGDEQRVARRLKREKFTLPEGCTFDDLYRQRNAENLGEVINIALDAIEDANREKLENVFRNIDFNSEAALGRTKQRNERLRNLLDDFNTPKLDMRPSRIGNLDVIGNAYEYLIGMFAAGAGKKAGEFYTPPAVSELLAELVAPKLNERVCDPACGSGSLLIRCAEQAEGHVALYGQENNGSTWALAKMNMFLHDLSADIRWGDTLNGPLLLEGDALMRFDVVVANPPFSLSKWGKGNAEEDPHGRFHRGVPPTSYGDYAFITHMIETTNVQTGRVGVIVPHGVLFRGSSEGRIRQKLIEENLLDVVIGLPANLFYGTGIPAAILLFKRNKRDDTVFFVDASREYADGTNQNVLRPEDIAKIVDTVRARQTVEKYAYLATRAEVAENDFNLNIPRYVDTFEDEPLVDLEANSTKLKSIETKLSTVETKMKDLLSEMGLTNVIK